ncbi:uncharacterized protein LOC101358841 isoform X2 [Trichechus manatus latirostris]|uniref:Uncharacterized protein LOC101358841 isoform X2 n=1 Tax=Trichechus manatus latirostris TaxID=127582 RepID=A0A2Y9RC80_TRIMA|nr:uncharacterized protein LOC101358841 isoform X2 [Trichechus manatus latirostris]
MASEFHMPGPVCLIENNEKKLMVNQEALKILSAITQPVVVVAIVGLYRTGKSYLMNKLTGKKQGFSMSSTVQGHTKGIWMWCVPHPKKLNLTLVLLDTEGLGDVEKGDNQNDSWIFALAILLSSTFIYNSMGAINQQAMDQLHYVTELTDRIRTKSSPDKDDVEDSADFVSFFPDFVWTLRDWTLNLEADGQPITADKYLENSLKLKPGISQKDKNFNLPRLCIQKFFPKKNCFVFHPPTEWKKLVRLETLLDDDLDPGFIQQVSEFCSYIFSHSKIKILPRGIKVNGPRLESLVLTYVNAINSGDLPCMENAVLALAQIENSAAVQKAIAFYDQQMGQKVQLPTETLQELLDLHRASEREAIQVFIRSSFEDVDLSFRKELEKQPNVINLPLNCWLITSRDSIIWRTSSVGLCCWKIGHSAVAIAKLALIQLEKKWDDLCKRNLQVSSDRCSALLQDIFSPLEEEVKQRIYSKPGGYHLFIQKTQELKKKYLHEPKKGIQAEEILQKYLMSKDPVTDAILHTDLTLTEKEKEIELERVKAESAQVAAKMLEEMQINHQQMTEQREKSHQEHMKQLTEKIERDRVQLLADQERILALKLQEQEQCLKAEFREERIKLQEEIQDLQMRNRETMEHVKAESVQTPEEMMEEIKYQQMMGQKEKSDQEYVKQLIEEMEKDRDQLLTEQDKTLALNSQETMAFKPIMEAPICLIENQNEQLMVNPKALKILDKISQPVVVVAIVGPYRTGKSYLMNRLAGQNHGFCLGSTVRSVTKGIWMWCIPHPSKPNHTLVLLDVEGLGNVKKSDPKNDSWIFILAMLLSSTFVYNSMKTIDHQALEQLYYVTELTELIRAKSSSRADEVEDSTEFVSFFPDFVWTVRDFTLELKIDGNPITEDEYLEDALKLIPGVNPKIQNSNLSRECIKNFFPKRKCFVFDQPTRDNNLLHQIEGVLEEKLDCNFQVKLKNFCSYIFSHAKIKTLREGIVINGNRLGTLVETYVDTINSGAVPCLEDTVTTLAQCENSVAVQKAADHYSKQMAQCMRFPTDTLQELLDVHAACEREAIALFMEHSFKDDKREFQKNLMETIEKKKEDFMIQNEEASEKYCQVELKKISEPLMASISRGTFSVPGGHSLYLEAKKKFEQNYARVPRKGVKANEVLQSFLQCQAPIEEAILQSDRALSDSEKAKAAMQAKKEAAEKKQELLKIKNQEQQKKMKAQERSFKENMEQLKQKIEREIENSLRDKEKMLEHKQKVQKELLNEGFEKKSEMLNKEINQLREKIETTKKNKNSWFSKALDTAGPILLKALPLLIIAAIKLY